MHHRRLSVHIFVHFKHKSDYLTSHLRVQINYLSGGQVEPKVNFFRTTIP